MNHEIDLRRNDESPAALAHPVMLRPDATPRGEFLRETMLTLL
jgi:hypothetical protein